MPVTPIRYPTPKPLPNPWHIPNTAGQSITTLNPASGPAPVVATAPAPVAPDPTPAPPPPPPPPDFNALTLADPQYVTAQGDLKRQNDLALANLLHSFAQTRQGYQDNANAHGALFSGAAIHAQNYAGQQYANQQAQQAENYLTGQHQNYASAWQRILAQYAPGGAA